MPVEWKEIEMFSSTLNYLLIAGPKDLRMDDSEFTEERFWRSLPIIENEELFSTNSIE